MFALSIVSGRVAKKMLSNTPMPPGTWLKMPVAWAITKGYCSLINGKLKTIDKPKTKNAKHLSYVGSYPELIEKTQFLGLEFEI